MAAESTTLRIEHQPQVTVVGFRDASILDMLTIQRVGKELYEIVDAPRPKNLILDFAEVRFLSSQALGVLLTLKRKAEKAGIKVALAAIRPELARVFKITNLDKLFEFFDDRAAALNKYAPPST
jgi:anti-sigma B factor antagonist